MDQRGKGAVLLLAVISAISVAGAVGSYALKMQEQKRRMEVEKQLALTVSAKEAAENGIKLDSAILLNCLSTLDVRSEEVMEKWKRDRVWLIRNNRTLQDLPQGEEYLEETIASRGAGNWNPEPAVRSLRIPLLIAHADTDESVPSWHGEKLVEWSAGNHLRTHFHCIQNGSHTLNTKHPFEGPNPILDGFLQTAIEWIRKA